MEKTNVLTGEKPRAAEIRSGLGRDDDASSDFHRRLIGWIGLLLPFALIALAVWRDGYDNWTRLDSISAYYYSGAAAAFLGMLVSLALFLIGYKGFDNDDNKWDMRLTNWAAVAALVVAFFPTKSPDLFVPEITPLSWWRPWVGYVHHGAAIALFSLFAFISAYLFTLPHVKDKTPEKRSRDRFHLICAALIVIAMAWAALAATQGRSIFWPESLALFAFAVSWLGKGRTTVQGALTQAPVQLASDVRNLVWWSEPTKK